MKVNVYNNNIENAIRGLKRKLKNDGLFDELRRRECYETPTEKKRRKMREAISRAKKVERKRIEEFGF
jgi:small subunit ribosomal protein S21